MLVRSCLIVALTFVAAGCATQDLGAGLGSDPAVERGRTFAEQRCAGCHAITLDESPGSSGPRFRDIQRRHNALSLERRLVEITQHGHFEMPALEFSAQQARDVAAYIDSLGE
jgi:mono/diheme cytochrome c family protein